VRNGSPETSGPPARGEGAELPVRPAAGEPTEVPAPATADEAATTDKELATALEGALGRTFGLFRSLGQPSGWSMTAAATLSTLDRNGPSRLTALAAREGVTQPAMTQLITRLADAGLVCREADPSDGRVVRVSITGEGKAALARRRGRRAENLAVILAQLTPEHRAALAAALPALDALASANPVTKEHN
jgi:DNA-binding MarR family transcriptional regulator